MLLIGGYKQYYSNTQAFFGAAESRKSKTSSVTITYHFRVSLKLVVSQSVTETVMRMGLLIVNTVVHGGERIRANASSRNSYSHRRSKWLPKCINTIGCCVLLNKFLENNIDVDEPIEDCVTTLHVAAKYGSYRKHESAAKCERKSNSRQSRSNTVTHCRVIRRTQSEHCQTAYPSHKTT